MSRPRGYIHGWQPRPDTAIVIEQVQGVLAEYRSYGPMTVRQIFYRLVGQHGYDKTELAYKRLAEYLVKARRAGLISFHSIRDDGTDTHGGAGYDSRAEWWEGIRADADGFLLDHQQGQAQRVEIWCEAAGMAPMLAQMTRTWHVAVHSTGGFSSVTVTKSLAGKIRERARTEGQRTTLLHVGDFDPSGESIFESMTEDVAAFLEGDACYGQFEPVRVALTAEQVDTYELPTAPPKSSDSRSRNWIGETTQAEALPPDLLREIVAGAVESYFDADVLADVLEREAEDKAEIDRVLKIAEGSE